MSAHEHIAGKPLDYNYIIEGIYIGTNQCCMMGVAEVLKKEGVIADISLEDIQLDQPFGVEMYTWIPTPDHTPPTPDQLSFGVSTLAKLVDLKKKVYVHCKNGHGRASTLVAAYLIHKGATLEEALRIIKEQRPTIHLQDSQREALEKFARSANGG